MSKEFDKKTTNTNRKRTVLTASYVTQVAVMAGMLSALKFALSFLPNVEVITLLIAVFSSVWGLWYSLPATLIFCLVEMAIYGIGNWLLLYFVYWPLIAVIFHFALRKKSALKTLVIATILGVVFSMVFGVLSACTETLLVIGNVATDKLSAYFVSFYIKGLWFDLVHTLSVGVSMVALYLPLVKVGRMIRRGALSKFVPEEDEYRREIPVSQEDSASFESEENVEKEENL